MLTPKKEPDTGGSSLGRVLKKAFKKKAVKVEENYDEEEAVKISMANSLNDVLSAKLEYALDRSARDHAREERQRCVDAEEAELLTRYERRRRRRTELEHRAEPELVVLDDIDEGEAGPSHQYRCGDDGAGCSAPPPGGDDDDDGGGDYSQQLYRNFGMFMP